MSRALVLGGGGLTGRAWEIGLLKGLRDLGVDVTQADLVIGTSAGSILGTQVRAGQSLDALYDAMFVPASPEATPDADSIDLAYYQETMRLWAGKDLDVARRIEVGQRALAAARVLSEERALRRAAARLGVADWPAGRLLISAVDVEDGSRRLIDRTQGVSIEQAIAASTSLPGFTAPISIGGRRYMDGGVGGTHVDGAAGYDLVVAVTPSGGPATEREIAGVRARGSQVVHIGPDAEAAAVRGSNSQDAARVPPSAEAGLRQARDAVAAVRGVWDTMTAGR